MVEQSHIMARFKRTLTISHSCLNSLKFPEPRNEFGAGYCFPSDKLSIPPRSL